VAYRRRGLNSQIPLTFGGQELGGGFPVFFPSTNFDLHTVTLGERSNILPPGTNPDEGLGKRSRKAGLPDCLVRAMVWQARAGEKIDKGKLLQKKKIGYRCEWENAGRGPRSRKRGLQLLRRKTVRAFSICSSKEQLLGKTVIYRAGADVEKVPATGIKNSSQKSHFARISPAQGKDCSIGRSALEHRFQEKF